MLDIIILFILTRQIGKLAVQKGLPSRRWKMHLIMGWLGGEFFGVVLGVLIFGKDDLFSCFLIGIGFAITAYLLIKEHLNKMPDVLNNDDYNNIGK